MKQLVLRKLPAKIFMYALISSSGLSVLKRSKVFSASFWLSVLAEWRIFDMILTRDYEHTAMTLGYYSN